MSKENIKAADAAEQVYNSTQRDKQIAFIVGYEQALVDLWHGWISVKNEMPNDGQIVDIWEMPHTERLKTALSLKGTTYANKHLHDTDYYGWRSTNYKFTIEQDGEGQINCFTQLNERYLTVPQSGASHKKLCVENGEVAYWMPVAERPC